MTEESPIPRLAAVNRRLDQLPLADQVYKTLRDEIVDGDYVPGTHLVQEVIAGQLGVSRTPVRDALIRLSHEGLLMATGARGFMVTEVADGLASDIYQVREVVEPLAAALALDKMSESDFRMLESVNHAMRSPHTPTQYYDLNRDFHLALVERCSNLFALQAVHLLWDQPNVRRIARSQVDHLDIPSMIKDHDEIIAAARRGDAELLKELLRRHMQVAVSSTPD
jgi:DNA-binding GntR family transcriptional regulator